MFFSLIVPVYNRPQDTEDLLSCLVPQTYTEFEVIVIESGSDIRSDLVVDKYKDRLNIRYFYKNNEGQGFSRNYGMERAKGDIILILDSDILLDPDFIANIHAHLKRVPLDAFGGPDRAHHSFSPVQKAIDYSLTSFFTTGGIRGNKKHVDKFYPRSFNMGMTRKVYERTGGFRYPFFGEDIELSARIMEMGFKVGLIPDAYVYHKRKTTLAGFYKQMHWTGRSRINIYKMFPHTLKLVHMVPSAFMLYLSIAILLTLYSTSLALIALIPVFMLILLIFADALRLYKNIKIALLTIPAFFIQMIGYGTGFLRDVWNRIILGKEAFCYDRKFIFKSVR